jgi:K+-transporting ATPase ATPase A chain
VNSSDVLQFALYLALLAGLAWPLGVYMYKVFDGQKTILTRICGPFERGIYRLCGIDPGEDMGWKRYATGFLLFHLAGFLVVFLLLRLQGSLPFNPRAFAGMNPHMAFNTAVSFMTNTNWQDYGGEATLSYLSQALGLAVQNFLSAASGMVVVIALARAFARREATGIGNFWADTVRCTLYVLLPLSLVLALALVSQGVVQTWSDYPTATLLDPAAAADAASAGRSIAVGPAAAQIAIKQLGTNGGGFFNVNSAHPFENPTPFSNLLETLAILAISAGLCVTFGRMVKRPRDGWTLLATMFVLIVPFLVAVGAAERAGNLGLEDLPIDFHHSDLQAGGNMEGKETRFGIGQSALWAATTTAASNGSVDSMHDSYNPLGGMVPMVLMQLGEVVFGGVGSGLYGMLLFALVAVFVAGLMVGRTPEYLGKKIESHEMKMAALGILVPPFVVLVGTALAVVRPEGLAGLANPGAHGFSEILYAFSSAGNNNGSAFAGLTVNTTFYDTALGLAMFFARFWVAIPALAVAGSLVRKKMLPATAGTLRTDGALFVFLLAATVLLVGALTFVPALALGPIAEHLSLVTGH